MSHKEEPVGDKVGFFIMKSLIVSLLVLALISCGCGNYLIASILYSSFVISALVLLVTFVIYYKDWE